MKDANGIRPATHAGDDLCRQLALGLENLGLRLAPNHLMKVAHHGGIRVCPQYTAEQVMRAADIGHPIAHGLVDGVFEGARTGVHAAHFGTQQPHAEDIQLLPTHVLGAHVDDALKSQQRTDGGSCHPIPAPSRQ